MKPTRTVPGHGVLRLLAVLLLLGAVGPGSATTASAAEILPNPKVSVGDGTATGPGLARPVIIPEADMALFLKGFLATGIFNPVEATPEPGARIYTVKFVLTAGGEVPGQARFAVGKNSVLVSAGDLEPKRRFIVAPPAAANVAQQVLAQVTTEASAAAEQSSGWRWFFVVVVALLALIGIVVMLMRRRRSAE